MSKKGVPKTEVVPRHVQSWPEDPAKKLQWMLEQRAFLQNKPFRSEHEREWLAWAELRIQLLRIAA